MNTKLKSLIDDALSKKPRKPRSDKGQSKPSEQPVPQNEIPSLCLLKN